MMSLVVQKQFNCLRSHLLITNLNTSSIRILSRKPFLYQWNQVYPLLSPLSYSGCHIFCRSAWTIWRWVWVKWEIRIWFHFSACHYQVWLAGFTDSGFSPISIFICFVKLMYFDVWVCMRVLNSVHWSMTLFYMQISSCLITLCITWNLEL